ncbi:MAG: hypothetical protein KAR12_12845 [Methylococcales bacterium]|nr:hypothetical protein [Methylococcales bacterium]
MKNIIIKTATPLSFVILLAMGGAMESHANGDKDLFLSNDYGEMLAFNSGVRGKPPYIRSRKDRKRTKEQQHNRNLQSVEMSALEIEPGSSVQAPSQTIRKSAGGGHPDRSKRHSYR